MKCLSGILNIRWQLRIKYKDYREKNAHKHHYRAENNTEKTKLLLSHMANAR